MHLYRWRGCDKKGHIFTGKYWAKSKVTVAEFVREKHGYVLAITRMERKKYKTFFGTKQLTDKQKSLFFGRLSSLVSKGIPLLRSLEIIEENSTDKIGMICSLLATDLEKGMPFAVAIRKQLPAFSPLAAQIAEAGEISGQLALLMGELSGYYLKEKETKGFLINACLYPSLVFTLTLLTMGYFFFAVLPMFGTIYEALSVTPGKFLTGILELSNFLKQAPSLLLLLFLGFMAAMVVWHKKIPSLLLKLPFVKKYHKTFLEIRYCRLLGLLLTSGITLPRALVLADGTLQSGTLKSQGRQIREKVIRGYSLGEAASLHEGIFSPVTREFIVIGENGGNLDTMLVETANILSGDLETELKNFKVLLEPVLLLVLAVIVGSGFCLFLAPIYDLLTKFTEF